MSVIPEVADRVAPSGVPAQPAGLRPAAWKLLASVAGASFVAHMLVAGNYGYYRDELYFIADGRHLQAGYVDQPLMMGWLAALMRVIAGDALIAIHVIPALACSALIIVAGLMARELGGGRVAQVTAAILACFTVIFYGFGSTFSMDVLDQLWWVLATFILMRLIREDAPRLWLLIGVVIAAGALTKLTVLFFCIALGAALIISPQRRHLLTPWPWLAAAIGALGLLPYLVWNALNGWPTWEFWHHYGRFGTSAVVFFAAQIVQMNPIAVPLAVAGLAFYFRKAGAPYRLLGWTFVFLYLLLAYLHVKPYFLAPAYPILYAPAALLFERLRLRRWLAWLKPAYFVILALVGVLIAPDVMPILPPATLEHDYPMYSESLADQFGWDTLTVNVEQVYASLPASERTQACVFTSNYGEASALQQLGEPGRLPPVISGENDYYIWGPGGCTGKVLILVNYPPAGIPNVHGLYRQIRLAATSRCRLCVSYERAVPIYVVSGAARPTLPSLWPSLKHFN